MASPGRAQTDPWSCRPPASTAPQPFRPPLRVLFLNCPFGRFFKDLCAYGDRHGFRFERMAFDAADYFEAPSGRRHLFRGTLETWREAIETRLEQGAYDLIILYNDALPMNEVAADCAGALNIPCLTLENGYLRPHWVTLEHGGVNGNSPLMSMPIVPVDPARDSKQADDKIFAHVMADHVRATMLHFTIAILLSPFFPYRPRYYGVPVLRQGIGYAVQYFRRPGRSERAFRDHLAKPRAQQGGRHFLCVLQKPGDTQLRVHSSISDNNSFLRHVLRSFARGAPADAVLAVKSHPYDYGIERTPALFQDLLAEFGLEGRCYYITKMKMHEVMPWADAIVVNNSSVGLEALRQHVPVKALGRSIYNRPGLTFSGPMDAFWQDPGTPDARLVEHLVSLLRRTSQVNGGFYNEEARSILFPNMLRRMEQIHRKAQTQVRPYSADHWAEEPETPEERGRGAHRAARVGASGDDREWTTL